MALTKSEIDTIYVYYGDPKGGTNITFYWQKEGQSRWSEFPLKLTNTSMIVKHTSCTTTIYYTFGDTEGELPTSNGPIIRTTDRSINFAISTSPSLEPNLDEEVTIGIITIDPHGHDWVLASLPPQARGKVWGKHGKPLTLKDLDHKTVKRIELLQKEFSNLDGLQSKGKMKMK